MDLKLFCTRELARIRTKEIKYNAVLDARSNYSPSFVNECRVLKEECQVIKDYLHSILASYDTYNNKWLIEPTH